MQSPIFSKVYKLLFLNNVFGVVNVTLSNDYEENSDKYSKEHTDVELAPEQRSNLPFYISFIPLFIAIYFASRNLGNWKLVIEYLIVGVIGFFVLKESLVIVQQWEETVVLRLGKYNRTLTSGLKFKIPILETIEFRDMRIRTFTLSKQEVLTKDNISVEVDAVVFMRVVNSRDSVIKIQDFIDSTIQISKTSLRNAIGQKELDVLLSKREEIASHIRDIIEKRVEKWGIEIESVELRDIILPEDMKRVMARQAEAERERRAVVIKSEGEVQASNNLLKASQTLSKSPIAFELRKLATLTDISADKTTIVFAVPLEVMGETMKSASGLIAKKSK